MISNFSSALWTGPLSVTNYLRVYCSSLPECQRDCTSRSQIQWDAWCRYPLWYLEGHSHSCHTNTRKYETWETINNKPYSGQVNYVKIKSENKNNYYSFKIFLRFWLVKTARIIQHNQLLLTQYWTNDVKSGAQCRILNLWPRKPGDKVVLFWWAEKQRAKWRNSFKNGEIFWMNNTAIIEFGFRRIWRILQILLSLIQ